MRKATASRKQPRGHHASACRLHDGPRDAEGRYSGAGTFHYRDGSRYEGDWKAGQRDGLGTYWFADGRRIVSMWADDRPHGEGVGFLAEWMVGEKAWKLRNGRVLPDGKSQCPPDEAKLIEAKLIEAKRDEAKRNLAIEAQLTRVGKLAW